MIQIKGHDEHCGSMKARARCICGNHQTCGVARLMPRKFTRSPRRGGVSAIEAAGRVGCTMGAWS